MIFLDTSAVLALTVEPDRFHTQATDMIKAAQAKGERILVHSYMLVETAALLQRRAGTDTALLFLKDAASFEIVWVGLELHAKALELLSHKTPKALSLVDAVSFLVMRSLGVSHYIGFDKHFLTAGFTQYLSE